MADKILKAIAKDGTSVEFVMNSDPATGAMKEVYFSPKKDYVVAFFKSTPDSKAMDRLTSLVGSYRTNIFGQAGGDFFKDVYCWPEKIVECDIPKKNGSTEHKIGITMPTYAKNFFFEFDPRRKGCEKEGKWFASAQLLRMLDEQEKGNFLNYLRICLKLARAIRRLHAEGLAHSDLSYKNVLIDPHGGNVCVIDVDSLVVPGKYPPDVLGTPDFIAPEVICDESKPPKVLPSQATDKFALSVLIYMYLLHRHPLKGGRNFGISDAEDDEKKLMGTDPLYIEHPTDDRNRNMKREYGDKYDKCLPWVDLKKFSAEKIAGPFLAELFKKAFIDGLKNPMARPTAMDWESALIKTSDRLLPCSNKSCTGKWFVFDNSLHPCCPFCGTAYKGLVPKLEFYTYQQTKKNFAPENRQLMVWTGQSLQLWHTNKFIENNEKLSLSQRKRVGYFQFFDNKWHLVNETLPDLYEINKDGSKRLVKARDFIVLEEGTKILFSEKDKENGARVAIVQLAGK